MCVFCGLRLFSKSAKLSGRCFQALTHRTGTEHNEYPTPPLYAWHLKMDLFCCGIGALESGQSELLIVGVFLAAMTARVFQADRQVVGSDRRFGCSQARIFQ